MIFRLFCVFFRVSSLSRFLVDSILFLAFKRRQKHIQHFWSIWWNDLHYLKYLSWEWKKTQGWKKENNKRILICTWANLIVEWYNKRAFYSYCVFLPLTLSMQQFFKLKRCKIMWLFECKLMISYFISKWIWRKFPFDSHLLFCVWFLFSFLFRFLLFKSEEWMKTRRYL